MSYIGVLIYLDTLSINLKKIKKYGFCCNQLDIITNILDTNDFISFNTEENVENIYIFLIFISAELNG